MTGRGEKGISDQETEFRSRSFVGKIMFSDLPGSGLGIIGYVHVFPPECVNADSDKKPVWTRHLALLHLHPGSIFNLIAGMGDHRITLREPGHNLRGQPTALIDLHSA